MSTAARPITAHLVEVDDVCAPRLQQLLLAVAPEHEPAAVVQEVAAEAEEVSARDGDEDRVQVRHSVCRSANSIFSETEIFLNTATRINSRNVPVVCRP